MVVRGSEAWLPPPRRCERRNRSPNAHFAVTGEALVAAKGAARRARRGVGGLVSFAVDVDERWRWGIRSALGRLRARDVGARTTMARTNQPHCWCGAAAFGRGWCELTCARERRDRCVSRNDGNEKKRRNLTLCLTAFSVVLRKFCEGACSRDVLVVTKRLHTCGAQISNCVFGGRYEHGSDDRGATKNVC